MTIEGASVTISADAKDENLLDELPSQAGNWVQNYGGSFVVDQIAHQLLPTIPYAVMVRSSEANISLTSVNIDSVGDVSITSDTATDSTTEAVAVRDTEPSNFSSTKGVVKKANNLSAGYSGATSTATTLLGGSMVISAGGDVLIESNAETIASITASTEINAADGGEGHKNNSANTNALGATIAISSAETTSTTLVDSGVEIIAATGNVNVRAKGDVESNATSGIEVFVDGRGGLGVALGFDEADILSLIHI